MGKKKESKLVKYLLIGISMHWRTALQEKIIL